MVKVLTKRSLLLALLIFCSLLLPKRAIALNPYTWVSNAGTSVKLYVNGKLVASAPAEMVDMIYSSNEKLQKLFERNNKGLYFKINRLDEDVFVISSKNGKDIFVVTSDIAEYHKSTPQLLAGIWLSNVYEALYGLHDTAIDKDYVTVTWYGGPKWEGNKTANGEIFYNWKLTAASNDLPFNSIVKLHNPKNNKSIIVRINDRCAKSGIIDVSRLAAELLGITRIGVAKLRMEVLHLPE